jgi:hypothetical protein
LPVGGLEDAFLMPAGTTTNRTVSSATNEEHPASIGLRSVSGGLAQRNLAMQTPGCSHGTRAVGCCRATGVQPNRRSGRCALRSPGRADRHWRTSRRLQFRAREDQLRERPDSPQESDRWRADGEPYRASGWMYHHGLEVRRRVAQRPPRIGRWAPPIGSDVGHDLPNPWSRSRVPPGWTTT